MLPIAKRDAKDIQKMIQRQNEIQRLNQNPEISYEEACHLYKLYKRKTLKANQDDSDFTQNMNFREFFLSVKKRYDVRFRAQKFRIKKKKEIAKLKQAAQGVTESIQDSTSQSVIGKRADNKADMTDEETIAMMQTKIQKLETEMLERERQLESLLQSKTQVNQKQPDVKESFSRCSTTITKSADEPEISSVSNKEIKPVASKSLKKQSVADLASILNASRANTSQSDAIDKLKLPQIQEDVPETIEISKQKSIVRIDLSSQATVPPASVVQIPEKSVADEDKQIKQREVELASCQQDLNRRVRDMIESQMFFAQMKQKPFKLIKKRDELKLQLVKTQQEIQIIEQNFKIVNSYIQSEQATMAFKQNQIFDLDKKIKTLISDLGKQKQIYRKQQIS